jgi:hypothetical protein
VLLFYWQYIFSLDLSLPQRFSIKDDTEFLCNYTRQRTEGMALPILSNISIVHTLFSNNGRANKTEKNFQHKEGLLKQRMMEEANEEFKQTERNPGLKTQTPQGNMGRTYRETNI